MAKTTKKTPAPLATQARTQSTLLEVLQDWERILAETGGDLTAIADADVYRLEELGIDLSGIAPEDRFDAIIDAVEAGWESIDEKADGYGYAILNLEADAEAERARASVLRKPAEVAGAKARAMIADADRLRKRILEMMTTLGLDRAGSKMPIELKSKGGSWPNATLSGAMPDELKSMLVDPDKVAQAIAFEEGKIKMEVAKYEAQMKADKVPTKERPALKAAFEQALRLGEHPDLYARPSWLVYYPKTRRVAIG